MSNGITELIPISIDVHNDGIDTGAAERFQSRVGSIFQPRQVYHVKN